MIIFLDVDGVLNKKSDWNDKYYLRKECLDVLSILGKKLNCSGIVLSSTWRACEGENEPYFYKKLKEELTKRGLPVKGITPFSNKTRQDEITYYTKRNNVHEYLILDDDESLFPFPNKIPLYLVNHKTGLSQKDIKLIIKCFHQYWRKNKDE